jgi:cobalt/nickel transport system permease protein
VSVEVGAIATAVELAASGTSPLRLALPAMAGVHALIGIGEAVITAGAVLLLMASRPEVLEAGETAPGRRSASLIGAGLGLALVVALFSPLASPHPDGLEAIAERQGFLGLGLPASFELLPDYTIPFVQNEAVTTLLAVAAGTVLVFGLALLVGRIAVQQQARRG